MTLEERKEKARQRAAAWRKANPERYEAAIEKCKAAKPEMYRALRLAYYERNKAELLAASKTRREGHPERYREYVERWNKENRQRRREIANDWRKRNQAYVNAVYARRRAAKLQATPAWANEFFMREAYHLSQLRTKLTGIKWHVDHIVPLTSPLVCGLHVEHNLQIVPARTNQSKNNRHWPDMP